MRERGDSAGPPDQRHRLAAGPTPKHVQLGAILRDLVEHELPPDSAVPSERELAQRFGVSRLTVREAIGRLVAAGLLTRVRGRGTFTARPRLDTPPLLSFTQELRRHGMTASSTLLTCSEEVPTTNTSVTLGLEPGEPAYRVCRLRLADGAPLALEHGWFSPRLVPGLLDHDLTGSLYSLLAQTYGVLLDRGQQTVWAAEADASTARLLKVRTSSPLLVFRRVSAAGEHPVEDTTSWYRGDKYQLTMSADQPGAPRGPHSAQGGAHER
ncbi:GntR family transcriptional regulator [Actinoalloteichus hoggarensis]|uniref:HTH-type transcriptional repressor YvoA n=1 Tax=Actinoalloteichus hoggarensis TaxID=1470176 RepID=A0A221W2J5_9PSEU|nr:GntR family transcriptional regulator [Actinoalloteichus hoggarensis]ASO19923.1 HTH-type transcriptional repressor YvoA [Actinoalloteichus hoggarensis]MBB5919367.1 GntR family transcriptional regulator [Actinoalloteichus hoggarensis]